MFIHTYRQNYYEFTAGKQDEYLNDEEFDELFKEINVKVIIIEDREVILPKILEESKRFEHISNFNLQQQESSDKNSIKIPIGTRTYDHLRKIHLCNESRKKYEQDMDIKYDLVIKSRFDIVYFNKIDWNCCLDNKFHFSYGSTFGYPSDTFCVTIPELMDRAYANRFSYLDEIFSEKDIGICSHLLFPPS